GGGRLRMGSVSKPMALLVILGLVSMFGLSACVVAEMVEESADRLVVEIPDLSDGSMAEANKMADNKFGVGGWKIEARERVAVGERTSGSASTRDTRYGSRTSGSSTTREIYKYHIVYVTA